MPRNVRNFWVEAEVDGRKTGIAFGPQGKDGGFELTVYMRNEGEVAKAIRLEGEAHGEMLTLWIDHSGGEESIDTLR